MARLAKAIGHPARVAILQYLIRQKSCICGDIVDEIGLSQPTISQHLRELKQAGLIQGSIEGRTVCYCIDPVIWRKASFMFEAFLKREEQPKSVLSRIIALLIDK